MDPQPKAGIFYEKNIQTIIFAAILFLMAILAVVAIYIFAAPFFINRTPTSVKVYTSLPMQSTIGQAIANGIRLSFEQHQYKAGGANVALIVNDDGDKDGKWTAEREEDVAKRAAADTAVVSYLGPFNSGAAKVGMPILNQAGILQISPGNTWPGLTKVGFLPGEPGVFYPTGIRHYFRVCTTDDLQGPAGALWAKELQFKKVFIVDDNDVYGTGIADLFEDKAKSIGLTVLGRSRIQKTDSTFETALKNLVAEIVAAKPELVYYGGITTNGGPEFLTALRKAGYQNAFMGPDGILEQDFIDRTGLENAEGIYATTVGVPPLEIGTPDAKTFYATYEKRFGVAPDVFSALGFEAANVALQAIARAPEKNRSAVLQQIRAMGSYTGILGTWSFDENGDTSAKLLSGHVVKTGRFVFVEKLAVP